MHFMGVSSFFRHGVMFVASSLLFGCGPASPTLGAPDASPSDDGPPADAAPLKVQSVPVCTSQRSVVTTGVGRFHGGSGSLAYEQAGGVWVLPASSTVATEVAPNESPFDFSVDDAFLLLIDGGSNQTLTTIDLATQTRRTLASAYWLYGGLCAHHAFWWETSNGQMWTLRTAPADGSGTPTNLTTQPTDTFYCDGAQMAWIDSAGAMWTVPASGGTPTKHATLSGFTWTLNGDSLYGALMGTPDVNHFTPFTIVSQPLDGGSTTTLASSLPPNYPPFSGSPGNGPSGAVRGSKRVFWAEFWGEGGAGPNGSVINWQLRAVAPSGGTVDDTIDSFTYTSQSTTTGTCPTLVSDGSAVYWTSEGTLMRLCE